MYQEIKNIEYKNRSFKIDLVKSDIKNIDNWDICKESAISGKAILRIAEINSIPVFYNPYEYGNHFYDFDVKKDIDNFIINNKNKVKKDANDYFILIYCDIEVDELISGVAKTIDNIKIIDKIIKTVLENIIL